MNGSEWRINLTRMETKTLWTFVFKPADDRAYSFNIIAPTREEALKMLRADLASIIAEVNLEEKK